MLRWGKQVRGGAAIRSPQDLTPWGLTEGGRKVSFTFAHLHSFYHRLATNTQWDPVTLRRSMMGTSHVHTPS